MVNPFYGDTTQVPLLREAFDEWKEGKGIFDAIYDIGNLPWDSTIESATLDVEYFGNHSGAKYAAPVVMHLLNEEDELSDASRILLAKIILNKFREPWSHLWETNVVQYQPIHNYNMSERRELVREDALAAEAESNSDNTTTHGLTNTTEDTIYGFNAGNVGAKDKKVVSTDSGTTGVEGSTDGNSNQVRNVGETEEKTRSGNIGVTTTQQLLREEREVWMWNFFDQVYKDIDTILSLPIYDVCRV